MKTVQTQAQVAKVETRVDRSMKVTLLTQEVSSTLGGNLLSLMNQPVWLILASNDVKEVELPESGPDAINRTKSQSQRLRAVIYRLWEQNNQGLTSEAHYTMWMDHLISQMKLKIKN